MHNYHHFKSIEITTKPMKNFGTPSNTTLSMIEEHSEKVHAILHTAK